MNKINLQIDIPEGLSKETKKFIEDVIRELTERGVLESIDSASMSMLATSYEMYRRATAILLRKGPVVVINYAKAVNPAQTVATKSYAQVIKIMTEYGLTVKSRSHIQSMNVDKSESQLDLFFKNKMVIEKR
jgi:P27 family predicted phage terminase small subunit